MNVLLKMGAVLTSATTILVATVVHVVMGMNRIVMVGLVQVSTSPHTPHVHRVGHFMHNY